jgi:hypothetical protein
VARWTLIFTTFIAITYSLLHDFAKDASAEKICNC